MSRTSAGAGAEPTIVLTSESVGIFAQRGRNRPNRVGSALCRVPCVEGTRLYVTELDAIDGLPTSSR